MNAAIEFLRALAQPVFEEESDVCWLDARNVDTEQGSNYCLDCGCARIDALNEFHPEGEYFLARSYGPYDNDGQAMCEKCGKYLSTALTRYGVESELEAFESRRLVLRGKHAPWLAYLVLNILQYAPYYEDDLQKRARKLERRIEKIRGRRATPKGDTPS